MQIRRKDNHRKILMLPNCAIRTAQGWLVPIFSEFPDDLFITYLDKVWELVAHDDELPMESPSLSIGAFDSYFGMAHQN